MDQRSRSRERNHRKNSGRRPVTTEYRSGHNRRGGRVATVAVVALTLIVIGTYFFMRAGLARMVRPYAASASASATTSQGATKSIASKPATPSQAASKSASSSVSAGASGGPAWRSADPSWMDKYKGKIVDGFNTEPGYKAVALTFDDGPNGETKYVIDTLSKVGGEATFFDTGRKLKMGWAKTQPAIIWNAGFELGNHTQHHTLPDGISSMWHRSYATDLAEINGPDVFAKYGTGRNTVWLRPMGGMIDATGVKAAVDTNHLVINWTIDSNDSHGGPRTPDYLYTQVTSNIKSGDVVLMHVTHPESMKALPRIVATLNARGFKLVTLSELAQHSTSAITQRIPK
jgi:peptidoglycan/xylan/chitin deacetylase (PgdA/CDA1 family)